MKTKLKGYIDICFIFALLSFSFYISLLVYGKIKELEVINNIENIINRQEEADKELKTYYKKQNETIKKTFKTNVSDDILNRIRKNCQKYNVDFFLVCAMIFHESNFRYNVYNINYGINSEGKYYVKSVDYGICQLNSNVYHFLSKKQFFDIDTNLEYGIKHIAYNLKVCQNNEHNALSMYNCGKIKSKSIYAKRILDQKQKLNKILYEEI
jgi:soluble lytic murein transglycosylase-like protein